MQENTEELYIDPKNLPTTLKMVRWYFGTIGAYLPFLTKRIYWKLFTTPRERKWLAKHDALLSNASSYSMKNKKYEQEFVVHSFGEGSKKALVLHGWEGRTLDFMKVIDGLQAKGYQVYGVDFPGHGKAAKSHASLPVFMETIQAVLKNEEFDLIVGHSLGAASLSLSLEGLKKKTKLVFLGLHPVPSKFVEQFKQIANANERTFQFCVKYGEKKLGVRIGELDAHHHIDTFNQHDVLFIHDVNDSVINLSRVETFSKSIESSELYTGDHGGHYAHFKHDDVVKKITMFSQN